ncbi:CYTH-like domain-containing protein [Scheffersomyces amazonensis]|uniref:CYTH-like domain-containing protein n=1 Tax=Scheffersomyces amazonensis TaxID=1078765 RepID=UPI00315C7BAB
MNVGSILNNDTPPSDHESEAQTDQQRPPLPSRNSSIPTNLSSHERHSITNILNEPTPTPSFQQNVSKDEFPKPTIVQQSSNGSKSSASSSSVVNSQNNSPYASKRNSIANIITNDKDDVDITTDKETEVKESESPKAKPESSPQIIKEEIQKEPSPVDVKDQLSKLVAIKKSQKPKRYDTPPIWAQRYIPPNRKNFDNFNNSNNVNGNGNIKYQITDKPVFDYTATRSLDLQVSITGVIPPSSLTRTVAEWIYANFSNINDSNRKNVELELKFGKIMDKRTGNRINVSVVTECIFTDHSNTFFDMQVEEIAWNDIKKFFEELEKGYQDELRNLPPDAHRSRRKFNMLESDITDTFYQVGGRGEHIKRVRISKDNSLKPPRFNGIEKQRVSDLFIHVPSSMYDLRLSLSLEIPVAENNLEPIMTKNKPSMVREKKRNTWTHAPTLTQFDLTRVLIPREAKNKHGKTIINHDVNYEVELEIDTLEVFNAIDKIVAGTDNYRLEELVEIFVNNARVLNNRITKLAQP